MPLIIEVINTAQIQPRREFGPVGPFNTISLYPQSIHSTFQFWYRSINSRNIKELFWLYKYTDNSRSLEFKILRVLLVQLNPVYPTLCYFPLHCPGLLPPCIANSFWTQIPLLSMANRHGHSCDWKSATTLMAEHCSAAGRKCVFHRAAAHMARQPLLIIWWIQGGLCD